MHRMKCKFELYYKPQHTKNRDPFEIRKRYLCNPERLTDNGILDTFLHRVRLEIMNERNIKKQIRQSNQKGATSPEPTHKQSNANNKQSR